MARLSSSVLNNLDTPVLGSAFDRDKDTRAQLGQVGEMAARFEGLRPQVLAASANAPQRLIRQAQKAGSLGVQQQLGDQATGAVTASDVLSNALRRAKARVGVAQRGEAAGLNQQLKDRLTQVRSGITGVGRAIDLQTAGQNIQSGVNVGVGRARDAGKASDAGLLGGLAGTLAGTLKGNFDNTGSIFDFGVKGPGIFKSRT